MNGNPVYLPPIWTDRDPVSETALKAVGFAIFMASIGGFISIWGG